MGRKLKTVKSHGELDLKEMYGQSWEHFTEKVLAVKRLFS